jgi:hydroxymethylglutaryl-CoA reductase
MKDKCSRVEGFYKKTILERQSFVQDFAEFNSDDVDLLTSASDLSIKSYDKISENVISLFHLPLGIATNFLINNKDYLIPMVTEEPSVVAAACNAAKLARDCGGFTATSTKNIMIGQIFLKGVKTLEVASADIKKNSAELLNLANKQDPKLVSLGGGACEIQTFNLTTTRGQFLSFHLLVDVKDAMGANIVNTMTEAIAPELEKLTGGQARLNIVSNLAIHRITTASATWSKKSLGPELIDGILDAVAIAQADSFRCATHNKGIMNGIDAVAIATGNDFRALEAGIHSFAFWKDNKYHPLTSYSLDDNGDLVGKIELPLAVGTMGGATQHLPMARLCLKILDVTSASELAQVIASVGLAQNFAALKAIVSEGIQKGHMRLHKRKELT